LFAGPGFDEALKPHVKDFPSTKSFHARLAAILFRRGQLERVA